MRRWLSVVLVGMVGVMLAGCPASPGTSVSIHDNSGPVTANVGGSGSASPGGTGNTGANSNNGGAAGTAPCAATGGGGTGASNTPNCGGQGATTTTTIPERTVQGTGAADLTAGNVGALLESLR